MANIPVEMFMKPGFPFCASAQNDNPSLLFYTNGENIGFWLKRSVNTLNIFDTQWIYLRATMNKIWLDLLALILLEKRGIKFYVKFPRAS